MAAAAFIASNARVGRIGLTGGIGSGKSTVAGLLQRRGAVLIDTDAIARAITQPGGVAIGPLRAIFGDDAIDASGALDRARMRALAFTDATARTRLEAVLHPLIGAETSRQAEAAGAATLLFDVPLLAESRQWRSRVERVLVVDCSPRTQVQRVMHRSGWDEAMVRSVIDQQATRPARRRCADAVIFNDGLSLQALDEEVGALWSAWGCAA